MSQIWKDRSGSGPITAGIETLTGNTTNGGSPSPVGPDGLDNVNTIGLANGGINVDGNPATSTLSYSLTSYSNQTVTTTTATANNTMTIPLGAIPGVYTFDINVAAFNVTDTIGAGFSLFASARTDGSSGTLIGIPDKVVNLESGMATSNVNLTVTANNAIIQVVGLAGKTIDWRSIVFYTFVS